MALRAEFVALAQADGANVRALCRQYGISPQTGYKWLARYRTAGRAGLADRSRRPQRSPRQTAPTVEAAVLRERAAHPQWGGRKLAVRLAAQEPPVVVHPNTITAILRRHGQLGPRAAQPRALQRFERSAPNELWQMDFKGHIALGAGGLRCHPLTVLDDHSRFLVVLAACPDEAGATVQAWLTRAFQRYGLPDRMLMDNGGPWGGGPAPAWTPLTAWLLRLGIGVSHGRPAHPQTQGKDERLHRTLKAELLQGRVFGTLAAAQGAFDAWRDEYNLLRPHEACGLQPPASRYAPSRRPWPDPLPPIEYAPGAWVRKVQVTGEIWFRGQAHRIAPAFRGYPVAVCPTPDAQVFDVYFLRHHITQLTLKPRAAP